MLALLRLLPIARLVLRARRMRRKPASAATMIGLALAFAVADRLLRRARS